MNNLENRSKMPEKSLFVSGGHNLTDASLPRRDFLRWTLTSGGIAILSPLPFITQGCGTATFQALKSAAISEMPWLAWGGKEFVSAAFAWVLKHYVKEVKELLPEVKELLPDAGDVRSTASALARKLGLKKENNPSPTRDSFHNSHAEKYTVTNRSYHRKYSGIFGCCVRQDYYLRCGRNMSKTYIGDLSALEIKAIAMYKWHHRTLLLPDGWRESPRGLVSSNKDWKLEYIRTFTDGDSLIKGYGFIHKGKQTRRRFSLR